MKIAIACALVLASAVSASAQNYITGTGSNPNSHVDRPYVTNDGNFVSGHQRTNPNSTRSDNYGTLGNFNPYNGQTGRRSRYND